MAQSANTKCEICMHAWGQHYCSQCGQFYCDDCKMSHLRSTVSRNHTFTTGSNIKVQTKLGGCKDQSKQPKQDKKKDQPPITSSSAVKQYTYKCRKCGTERLSEEPPFGTQPAGTPPAGALKDISDFLSAIIPTGAWLDCAKCGPNCAHLYQGEA